MVVSPPHLTVSVHQEGEIVIRREHISVFQPCHIKKTNMIINSKQMLRNVFINFYLSSPISIGIGSACRLANQVHSEKSNLRKNKVRERCDQLTPGNQSYWDKLHYSDLVILVLPVLVVFMENKLDKGNSARLCSLADVFHIFISNVMFIIIRFIFLHLNPPSYLCDLDGLELACTVVILLVARHVQVPRLYNRR